MRVKELIGALMDFDDDEEVFLAYPSGDYWRTEVALPVASLGEEVLVPSPYHGDGHMRVVDEGSQEDREEVGPYHLVLRMRR